MDIIESMNHVAFNDYLKQYHNTICGRHPIGVLLGVRYDHCSICYDFVETDTTTPSLKLNVPCIMMVY